MKKAIQIAAVSLLFLAGVSPAVAETDSHERSMNGGKAEQAESAGKEENRESMKKSRKAEKLESARQPEKAGEKSIEKNGGTEHESVCNSRPWLCND